MRTGVFFVFAVLAVIMLTVLGIGGCSKTIAFQKGCEDYLKLAGDAPTLKLASTYLHKSLQYMEENDLTDGNCAYLFHNPSSDLGLWYNNVKGATDEVDSLMATKARNPTSVQSVDESNMLVKVREVVIDHGSEGSTSVTTPSNAWIYPLHWLWAFGWALLIVFVGVAAIAVAASEY